MKSRGNQTCARWLQSNRSQTESSCYGLEGHDFDFVGDGDGDGALCAMSSNVVTFLKCCNLQKPIHSSGQLG